MKEQLKSARLVSVGTKVRARLWLPGSIPCASPILGWPFSFSLSWSPYSKFPSLVCGVRHLKSSNLPCLQAKTQALQFGLYPDGHFPVIFRPLSPAAYCSVWCSQVGLEFSHQSCVAILWWSISTLLNLPPLSTISEPLNKCKRW